MVCLLNGQRNTTFTFIRLNRGKPVGKRKFEEVPTGTLNGIIKQAGLK